MIFLNPAGEERKQRHPINAVIREIWILHLVEHLGPCTAYSCMLLLGE